MGSLMYVRVPRGLLDDRLSGVVYQITLYLADVLDELLEGVSGELYWFMVMPPRDVQECEDFEVVFTFAENGTPRSRLRVRVQSEGAWLAVSVSRELDRKVNRSFVVDRGPLRDSQMLARFRDMLIGYMLFVLGMRELQGIGQESEEHIQKNKGEEVRRCARGSEVEKRSVQEENRCIQGGV